MLSTEVVVGQIQNDSESRAVASSKIPQHTCI
jgi:hypothetical protein